MTLIRTLLCAGTFVGVLAVAGEPSLVSPDTLIPMGVVVTYLGGAWYLSHQLTRTDVRVTKAEADFERFQTELRAFSGKLDDLARTLADIRGSLERLKTQMEERT